MSGQVVLMLRGTDGLWHEAMCTPAGELVVAGVVGGGTGGTSGGLTDAQLRASAVPVSAVALPLPTGAATSAAQATTNSALGAPADARAAWYDSAANIIQLLKLSVAAFVGAGSRAYTYTNGVLTAEAWTLFGTTRTKTYTYTNGVLTAESDWV